MLGQGMNNFGVGGGAAPLNLGNPYNNLGPPGLGMNKGFHHMPHKTPIIEDEMKDPKEDSEEESKADNKKQPKVSDLKILPLLYIKNIAQDEVLERWAIRFQQTVAAKHLIIKTLTSHKATESHNSN